MGNFQPNYPHPFWYSESLVHVFHYSTIFLQKKVSLYIHIPNIYLGLGFEFWPQRIRDLAIVCLQFVIQANQVHAFLVETNAVVKIAKIIAFLPKIIVKGRDQPKTRRPQQPGEYQKILFSKSHYGDIFFQLYFFPAFISREL